jgi:hypothetical protein
VETVTPSAPTGCSGEMGCDGVVEVRCATGPDPLLLYRSTDNVYWALAAEQDSTSGPLLPSIEDRLLSTSATPEVRQYEVCTKSFSSTRACSPSFPVTVHASTCPVKSYGPTVDCSNRSNWVCNFVNGKEVCQCKGAVKPMLTDPTFDLDP